MTDPDLELAAELGLEPLAPTEPAIIDAEIVPRSALKRKTKKVGAHPLTAPEIRRRDRITTEVALFTTDKKYQYGRLSDRERKLVNLIIKGWTQKKAAEEIGISERSAVRYLKRPFVRAYIEQMRQRAAGAADLTPEKIANVLNRAADGEDVKPTQLAAAGIAARLLAPPANAKGGTSITVNQQNNYNGVGASPFAEMKREDILLEMQRVVDESGDGETTDGG